MKASHSDKKKRRNREKAWKNKNDTLTYYHQCKLKSFFHRLAMNLIRQVGKPDVSRGLRVGELSLLQNESNF